MNEKFLQMNDFASVYVKLQQDGWNPQLCNTEVPLYESEVPCGPPEDVTSEILAMASLPDDMIGDNPTFMVRAKGDSMVDLSIMPGDILLVEYGIWPQEQDTVLAYIDGAPTIKSFHTSPDGTHWLVPNNEKMDYKAIPLDEGSKVKITGVVKASLKKNIRATYRKCEEIVNQTRQEKAEPEPEITEQNVSRAIRNIAGMVQTKRQWYSVYMVMLNYNLINDGDFEGFCDRVRMEVPYHHHLPTVAELQRMAVMSFVKPVRQWNVDYAPVTGKRFKDYKNIALKTDEFLF